MKLTVSRDVLLLALSRAQGIVGKKTTMPILSNVLLEAQSSDRFSITATDLDIFSKGEYEGLIDERGKICVNARDLFDWTRALPAGNVILETIGTASLKVDSANGKDSLKLPAANVEDYPAMPSFGDVPYFKLKSAKLVELITHTIFSVANDDPRIFLNGVNLETREGNVLRMVSTDGHRLSLIDRTLDEPLRLTDPVIIPRKGVLELRKLLEEGSPDVELGFSVSNGFFKWPGLLLVMRLIEGEFPDYNMVIPKSSDRKLTLNRQAFQEALKRQTIASAERSFGVRLVIAPGQLVIESSAPERGEGRSEIEADYSGEAMQVGFNAKYFLDSISVMAGDVVVLELSDELSPCIVRDGEDLGYLSVVMPVRIS